MKRTLQQNSILHSLISKLKISDETKASLVFQYTGERETSTSEMTADECQNLINHLRNMANQPAIQKPIEQHLKTDQMDKKRKRLISKYREMGFNTEDNKADMKRINESLQKHWKKTINELDSKELSKIIAVVGIKFIANFYDKSNVTH